MAHSDTCTKAADMAKRLFSLNDGKTHSEPRLVLGPDPTGFGSISLGYSGGKLKAYVTKFVGQKGCIDWDLDKLLSQIRECIESRSITGDMRHVVQNVSNQLMPGLKMDIPFLNGANIFVRPHTDGSRAGFMMVLSRGWNLNDLPAVAQSQLSAVLNKAPLYSLFHRSVGQKTRVGDVKASLFGLLYTNGRMYAELCIYFMFNTPFAKEASATVHSFVADLKKSKGSSDQSQSEESRKGVAATKGTAAAGFSAKSVVPLTCLAAALAIGGISRFGLRSASRL